MTMAFWRIFKENPLSDGCKHTGLNLREYSRCLEAKAISLNLLMAYPA